MGGARILKVDGQDTSEMPNHQMYLYLSEIQNILPEYIKEKEKFGQPPGVAWNLVRPYGYNLSNDSTKLLGMFFLFQEYALVKVKYSKCKLKRRVVCRISYNNMPSNLERRVVRIFIDGLFKSS